ncbi:MAG: polyribonucleotide nucleotidyltransferase [Candidatus Yanofskybacteria bacterium RIFCSPLOWO2_01_FULL_49_25]|uniref:Polyribonucleotide nucleotidyltransferase n=1 Tax=Candidatus Yanofskybacteria bacterium RIFCSPLOWO2_01_FULL_49_25 TaxID=1802701 RepID=A0A1F8GUJ0_9BACT|nr:MAG: polyribonucleotide nucleotidyltransferase [Candidatus Yanofskybacteria bacterium RIFCSPLOWO2_01_FULL_49_25]
MEVKRFSREFAGRTLTVELGKLAQQANGSCYVQYGDTAVLVTAVMSPNLSSANYFPLSVEYEERYYAAGKIKGSKWIKREGRPSDEAVLSGRLIDRALRPRFDSNIRNDIQVIATVLSFDRVNDPDVLSLFGASLALMVSNIPFDGPVAGVRVGRVDGKHLFNPTYAERLKSDFDIVIAGTSEKMNMIEAGANIVPEADIASAITAGFKEFQHLIKFQEEIANELKPVKRDLTIAKRDEVLAKVVSDFVTPKLEEVLYTPHKQAYVEGLRRISGELETFLKEQYTGNPDLKAKLDESKVIFEEKIDHIVHKNILESEKRPDGRRVDELRGLSSEVAVLPYSHGSGLFNRGTTQALSILTLAAPGMEQWVETMEIELTKKRFMHHYAFPPFSVGEVGRLGSPKRRELGHGYLAERAMEPLLPPKEEFPYTIRVVSEILSSNGSSSMASVCGSILAMMDGGVPLKAPAAGIAMGLMFDDKGEKFKILTDIQGPEDHHGDMDMKVAGTKDGITAMQMDVKIDGINEEVLIKTLEQAKRARLEILEVMFGAIKEPRAELSKYAPRVLTIQINPEKIGALIGPQGKVINKIIEETGVAIDIEDDGLVFITSDNSEAMEKAKKLVLGITYEAKAGDEFEGRVTRLLDFGALVEYMPGKEGLVHVTDILTEEKIRRPSDALKVGQVINVRVKNVDEYGRINLTMRT